MLDVTGLVFQAGLLSQEPRSLNSKGEIAGVGGAPPPAPGSCLRDEHSLGVPCLGMPCLGVPSGDAVSGDGGEPALAQGGVSGAMAP